MKRYARIADLSGFEGNTKLFALTPPVTYTENKWNVVTSEFGETFRTVTHVAVSASRAQTVVLQADENGRILDWSPLGGSSCRGLRPQDAVEEFLDDYCEVAK